MAWDLSVIALVCVIGMSSSAEEADRRASARAKWVRQTVERLKGITVSAEAVRTDKPWMDWGLPETDAPSYWLCLGPREGVIRVGKDDWVYVASSSCHDRGKAIPIGDVIVARDAKGRFFISNGHVCGSVSVYSPKQVESVDEFWAITYCCDKEHPWRKLLPADMTQEDEEPNK